MDILYIVIFSIAGDCILFCLAGMIRKWNVPDPNRLFNADIPLSLADIVFGFLMCFTAICFLVAGYPLFTIVCFAAAALVPMIHHYVWPEKDENYSRLSGRQKKPAQMDPSLIGKVGHAITELSPMGLIDIEQMKYQAKLEAGSLRPGSPVLVKSISGLVLIVEQCVS